jgi:PIN domain nuclease of toxin-antitoxin system
MKKWRPSTTERTDPLLFDTPAFIWAAHDPDRLSTAVRSLLRQRSVTVYLSVASIWEISLKNAKGKLNFSDENVDAAIQRLSASPIPIRQSHIRRVSTLPISQYHKDPFDRLLVAQALAENLTLLSCDKALKAVPELKLLW